MNKVVWFDIPVRDLEAASDFYGAVFGWKVAPRHAEDGRDRLSFRIAETGPEEMGEMPHINGGIVTREIGLSQPSILVQVDDIPAKIEEIVAQGGERRVERTALPLAGGAFAYVADPDGNVIGLWEVVD